MTDPRSPLRAAAEWLTSAEEDLATAQLVAEHGAPPRNAAFFAQQAAEKALKAMCAAIQTPVLRTHSLQALLAAIAAVAPDFAQDWEAADDLTPFAVEGRYPDTARPVYREDVEMALTLATNLLAAAREWIDAYLPPPEPPHS
jgi:HEPN domain-containing protein